MVRTLRHGKDIRVNGSNVWEDTSRNPCLIESCGLPLNHLLIPPQTSGYLSENATIPQKRNIHDLGKDAGTRHSGLAERLPVQLVRTSSPARVSTIDVNL